MQVGGDEVTGEGGDTLRASGGQVGGGMRMCGKMLESDPVDPDSLGSTAPRYLRNT